jgi:DNA-directed RNA polymerase specialized sigma24 family protein
MDLAEVGACLGISAATAAVRLSRARAALRERLNESTATKQAREAREARED